MEVRMIAISELIPYEKNPRRNDKAVDAVAKSIQQFGFKVPLVIDKDKFIVAGHTRYKAAIKLGLTSAPCIEATDLTEAQIKAFRLVENKTSELSKWDLMKLGVEIREMATDLFSEFNFDFSTSYDEIVPDMSRSLKPKKDFEEVQFIFAEEQIKFVEKELTNFKDEVKETFDNPNKKGNALYEIVRQWSEQKEKSNGNRD